MFKQNMFLAMVISIIAGCHGDLKTEPTGTVPASFEPVPTTEQMQWQRQDYGMFIHYCLKTYYPSNDHKGSGKDDPKKFNPQHFDADQWAKAAKAGGFGEIVLTTKHHAGFCNWQTETTDYSVRSTPWKDGKGDVVAEVAKACRKEGLRFGLYLSIWDRHYELSGGDPAKYSDYYIAQITELLTKYGRIDELWFDGFGSKDTNVDFEKVAELIRTHQPQAVVYDSGTLAKYLPDRCLRWPGRHGGVKDPNWSRYDVDGQMRWYPLEASLMLQGNWFHDGKPAVGLEKIQDYYLRTVGSNALPLMNVSPNQDGLIDEATVDRLKEFKAWVDDLYASDIAKGKKITADTIRENARRFSPANAVDGKYDTYYATDDDVTSAVLEIDLGKPQEIEGFVLQEYIPLGQRVSSYSIECWQNGEWVKVFSGRTIGYKKIILEGKAGVETSVFPKTDRVRLKINEALACPLINTFSVIGHKISEPAS